MNDDADQDDALPYEQAALEASFLSAVEAMNAGRAAEAEQAFRAVLLGDPRLPEPRLELAVLLLRRGELEEAEAQARLALTQIERGWQWLEDFEPAQLEAHALNLLGEILLRDGGDADIDDVIEDAPDRWREAERLFRRAAELDPDGPAAANLQGFRRRRARA